MADVDAWGKTCGYVLRCMFYSDVSRQWNSFFTFSDADDFEPELPQKVITDDKWQGEDEEEDVKVSRELSLSICRTASVLEQASYVRHTLTVFMFILDDFCLIIFDLPSCLSNGYNWKLCETIATSVLLPREAKKHTVLVPGKMRICAFVEMYRC